MTDLTYQDENGEEVYTSQYLKNKKTCCKTKCLHCPYGFTLKSLGLEFTPVTKESIKRANHIISLKTADEKDSVASSMLASAFGSAKKTILIKDFSMDKYFFIKIKDVECGIVKKGIVQLSEIYLKEQFTEQGLDLDSANSFFENNC